MYASYRIENETYHMLSMQKIKNNATIKHEKNPNIR